MMLDQLTPAEEDVVQLMAKGYTTEEMAIKLHRSFDTVKTQRYKALQKLAARNSAQAIYNWLMHYDKPN